MKGQILDFSIQAGGLISSEDGKRYPFKNEEWKEQGVPTRGMKVDFDVDETGQAVAVYKALGASSTGGVATVLQNASQTRNENGQLSLFALFLEALTKRYAQFSGHASKREFWGFLLFRTVAEVAILLVIGIMVEVSRSLGDIFSILYFLFTLAVLVPTISVGVRRLHDTGKSGWWYLISVIPLIGWIWLIILWCQASVNEDNQWGGLPEN
ncbi:DUF805 domain-containing protein [Neisseria sp. Marseille-Q1983]|uniref:DUF805 domain-containing protein n=1 Tax=Neisseria sp. Marseille-Q1983 TaxID=2830768 RepID=UPI001BADAC70|nr:DUF805 domain-containing protein [Neisseria sp. Marseille-Q1983]